MKTKYEFPLLIGPPEERQRQLENYLKKLIEEMNVKDAALESRLASIDETLRKLLKSSYSGVSCACSNHSVKDGKDGENGQNGITPQLRINKNNEWEVSYDKGVSWESLGVKATGPKGEDGENGTAPTTEELKNLLEEALSNRGYVTEDKVDEKLEDYVTEDEVQDLIDDAIGNSGTNTPDINPPEGGADGSGGETEECNHERAHVVVTQPPPHGWLDGVGPGSDNEYKGDGRNYILTLICDGCDTENSFSMASGNHTPDYVVFDGAKICKLCGCDESGTYHGDLYEGYLTSLLRADGELPEWLADLAVDSGGENNATTNT